MGLPSSYPWPSLCLLLLLILPLFFAVVAPVSAADTVLEDSAVVAGSKYSDLLSRTLSQYQKKDVPFSFPNYEKKKGLYRSDIHINLVGGKTKSLIRDKLQIYDSNFFVSAFVNQLLLESEALGTVIYPTTTLSDSLTTLSTFKDRNLDANTPIRTFWPQELNPKTNRWEPRPTNIMKMIKTQGSVAGAFKKIILSLPFGDSIWKSVENIINAPAQYLSFFFIPSDFDDTAANVVLGTRLKHTHPDLYDQWAADGNNNFLSYVTAMKKYAYTPFANDTDANLIDPRSYYFISDFLYQKQKECEEPHSTPYSECNLSLITTWAQDVDGARALEPRGMPFNVNNVDVSVVADATLAMSLALIEDIAPDTTWFDPMTQNMYKHSIDFVAWAIDSGMALKRPDIGLLYYPSVYDLYWFVSRHVADLRKAKISSPEKFVQFPLLNYTLNTFEASMKGAGTSQILSRASRNVDWNGSEVYWEDFIGGNDTGLLGGKIDRGGDRTFTTAVALNALFDTWTVPVPGTTTFKWAADVPPATKGTFKDALKYLSANYQDSKQAYNPFFSGDLKGRSTFPYVYPHNVLEHLDGSPLVNVTRKDMATGTVLCAVSGMIDATTYASMMNIPQAPAMYPNLKPPQYFTGFNDVQVDVIFPYWSSSALTYSFTLLALSKDAALVA
eukprot:TRINITY_DN230_c1_g1_i2.p1 TRINITY_DN230_c1_g1~~TRINITY_DN230_c1_g1_i2.p1  ORF type:complete len:680 (+),score=143.50 TRINITY_DN230_c1_g1_i2:33-2042(+)